MGDHKDNREGRGAHRVLRTQGTSTLTYLRRANVVLVAWNGNGALGMRLIFLFQTRWGGILGITPYSLT